MVTLAPGVPSRTHRTKTRHPPNKRNEHQRRDIQGLRAIAVIAVILDHLVHWPSGGFVGVDVFLVISGFMITGQLMREHERDGRVSLPNFYRRRVRRLVPASLTVLAVTVGGAALVFSVPRFLTTVADAVAALFFAGNWRMARQGTDYFQSTAPPSPLQHFWSLGVEEQFYLVWPALMVVILLVAGTRANSYTKRARMAVGTATALIISASFAWSVIDTAVNPTWAYFSTFSRAWELGLGALVAVTANLYQRIPQAIRPLLAWAGIAGIATSLFEVAPTSLFPGPWAALPVASTALVIIANQGGRQRLLAPLTNPVSVYLGDISYSLYLWHFPLIIFVGVFADTARAATQLISAAGIVLVSVYSYHLLEDPIRRSSWLEKPPANQGRHGASRARRKARKRRAAGGRGTTFTTRYKITACSLLAIVAASLIGAAFNSTAGDVADGQPAQAIPPVKSSPTAGAPAYGPAVTDLQKQIATALNARTWPKKLVPSMDEAIADQQVPHDINECALIKPISVDKCTWGASDAKKTAVIVGDSVAVAYVEALREAIADQDHWNLRSYATYGCSFTKADVKNGDADVDAGCPAKKEEALRGIRELKPDVVFVANTYQRRKELTTAEMAKSTRALLETVLPSTNRLVLLSPPPADVNIEECYSRISKPRQCISRVDSQWFSTAKAERATASGLKGDWIDSRPLFCLSALCPSFVGHTPVKSDRVHMTSAYARNIAPALAETLKDAGVVN